MSNDNKNILDPSAILHSISQIVTELKNPHDAIAAGCHAIMLNAGFSFAGLGDDARQEGDGSSKTLPTAWNENGPHHYNFRYSHRQSSLTFVIKIVRLGGRCIILGLGFGDDKTYTLDIVTEDYTSESFFPYNTSSNDQPLVHGFISSNRFQDFIKAYKLNLIQRLTPGLNKPGYEDEESSNSVTTSTPTRNDNTRQPPRNEQYIDPYFNEPSFVDVGRDDLNPLGSSGLRLPGTGGGMRVGPDHPIFGNPSGSNLDDPSGLFGGPQPLPRGSVPPGARFDPIGPFGTPPMRPPGRDSGRRTFRGEPDNDEPMPPGYDDMFG